MLQYIKVVVLLSLCLLSNLGYTENSTKENISKEGTAVSSTYVYKIMTLSDWQESQKLGFLKPSALDLKSNFMHLSEEQQVKGTIDKFMKGEANIIVLKLDTSKFIGRLVKEKNPGGNTEYFHLYDGKIPLEAVVESKKHIS